VITDYTTAKSRSRFHNIRFTLAENKKGTKTTIVVETFEAQGVSSYMYLDNKTKKAYREMFKQLFAGDGF
jgi:hypothetical protein